MVEYVGAVPGDGAVSFLSRFDLFVFPTLGENFGHVVLESLAAGTPVIEEMTRPGVSSRPPELAGYVIRTAPRLSPS